MMNLLAQPAPAPALLWGVVLILLLVLLVIFLVMFQFVGAVCARARQRREGRLLRPDRHAAAAIRHQPDCHAYIQSVGAGLRVPLVDMQTHYQAAATFLRVIKRDGSRA